MTEECNHEWEEKTIREEYDDCVDHLKVKECRKCGKRKILGGNRIVKITGAEIEILEDGEIGGYL